MDYGASRARRPSKSAEIHMCREVSFAWIT
jgi:hypothetical protein